MCKPGGVHSISSEQLHIIYSAAPVPIFASYSITPSNSWRLRKLLKWKSIGWLESGALGPLAHVYQIINKFWRFWFLRNRIFQKIVHFPAQKKKKKSSCSKVFSENLGISKRYNLCWSWYGITVIKMASVLNNFQTIHKSCGCPLPIENWVRFWLLCIHLANVHTTHSPNGIRIMWVQSFMTN